MSSTVAFVLQAISYKCYKNTLGPIFFFFGNSGKATYAYYLACYTVILSFKHDCYDLFMFTYGWASARVIIFHYFLEYIFQFTISKYDWNASVGCTVNWSTAVPILSKHSLSKVSELEWSFCLTIPERSTPLVTSH